jgi:hypothetical protein
LNRLKLTLLIEESNDADRATIVADRLLCMVALASDPFDSYFVIQLTEKLTLFTFP